MFDSMAIITWQMIIETTLDGLPEIERKLLSLQSDETVQLQLFYVRVLIAYFRNNPSVIQNLLQDNHKLLQISPALTHLTKMRLLLRQNQFELFEMIKLKELVCQLEMSPSIFLAEAEFISATACLSQGENLIAEKHYQKAASEFEKVGCIKKSLRAQLSSLAAYSCAYPDSRLFYEYNVLYEKAILVEEHLTAGTALLNISRELQKLRASSQALATIDKAIEILRSSFQGSREFGLSLAHRADLLFQLNRIIEAEHDTIHALCNPYPEVQAACEVLAQKNNLDLVLLKNKKVLPTWEERQKEIPVKEILSPMESLLIKLISEKPRSKFELMDTLFGEKISLDSKDNRLKNLISRTRSKVPGVIQLQNGFYEIIDIHKIKVGVT